jgi:hypothetical protein
MLLPHGFREHRNSREKLAHFLRFSEKARAVVLKDNLVPPAGEFRRVRVNVMAQVFAALGEHGDADIEAALFRELRKERGHAAKVAGGRDGFWTKGEAVAHKKNFLRGKTIQGKGAKRAEKCDSEFHFYYLLFIQGFEDEISY